ncbi:hypothetical protein [Paraferrimonas haliotis]|uniref:Uncharacterized protein n=1 Tax=Paraferrimonas haliotis TaxID=2013866 RepID=A0AA37WZ97_9GAMM|nr:hypothetical protein [Paraferrimonas haliotis]GLS84650.1 hypothetical protein GCM10007894_26270 [Paraferrimonas haliotis]
MSYDASSIRVLRDDEIRNTIPFELIGSVATDYGVATSCVRKAWEAAHIVGVDFEHYVQRYLKGDKSIAQIPEFERTYFELMKDEVNRARR